jgi:hypothetical protein
VADKKVSQLTSMTSPASPDLLLIINDPNGTPESQKITVKTLFGNIPSNTAISGITTLRANSNFRGSNTFITSNVNIQTAALVKANNFILTLRSTPGSNNAASGGYLPNQIFFTNTHLYIAVNATTLKRVALSVF